MADQQTVLDDVKEYYGKILQTSDDLNTNACETACQKMPSHLQKVVDLVHDDVHTNRLILNVFQQFLPKVDSLLKL